ncbi:alpha/beta hydrolase [Niabella sp. W65]|nr:alpha/beta hydrolase [Niabella sp. W65]MCH7368127.1 alpha/beta hydrolase [Niabella sp. W65]ULT43745.1 alpha/beta hydrolase [Niabella sp. I65]
MSKIYVFSGLGADRRVFNNIDFGDLDITHVEWIKPEPDEPLVHYAQRIAANRIIPHSALIGLSFGGMLAVEIAKLIPVDQIILIASAKTKNELPRGFLMKCLLKLSTFIPEGKLTSPNAVADWFFGANTASEKQLLRDILKDTDPAFFKWAINEIIHWENETMPAHSIHIHGNKDRIIPIKNVKADYVIEGGGHLMTVNKAAEVEHIIRSVFKNE